MVRASGICLDGPGFNSQSGCLFCLTLDTNHNAPSSSSLFAYTSSTSGRWEHLTKYKFMEFCIGVWSVAALAHVLGHSFWIGGAVELLASVSPEIIVVTRGWISLCLSLILATDRGDFAYEYL